MDQIWQVLEGCQYNYEGDSQPLVPSRGILRCLYVCKPSETAFCSAFSTMVCGRDWVRGNLHVKSTRLAYIISQADDSIDDHNGVLIDLVGYKCESRASSSSS